MKPDDSDIKIEKKIPSELRSRSSDSTTSAREPRPQELNNNKDAETYRISKDDSFPVGGRNAKEPLALVSTRTPRAPPPRPTAATGSPRTPHRSDAKHPNRSTTTTSTMESVPTTTRRDNEAHQDKFSKARTDRIHQAINHPNQMATAMATTTTPGAVAISYDYLPSRHDDQYQFGMNPNTSISQDATDHGESRVNDNTAATSPIEHHYNNDAEENCRILEAIPVPEDDTDVKELVQADLLEGTIISRRNCRIMAIVLLVALTCAVATPLARRNSSSSSNRNRRSAYTLEPTHSPVPTVIPTAFPSVTPTLAPTWYPRLPFDTSQELLDAVNDYLQHGQNSTAAQTYGYPIGSWDVSRIQDFTSLFDVLRNENAQDFDEDLSLWNVGQGVLFTNMFAGVATFNSNIGNWNMSSAQDCRLMFYGYVPSNLACRKPTRDKRSFGSFFLKTLISFNVVHHLSISR